MFMGNREVLQTEFRKLRQKRAAAGCESRKIMAHLSENPSECSVRLASNRTKFSVRLWFAAVPRSLINFQHCNRPIHRDSVWCQSTNSGETSSCRFAFRNPVVQASLVCSLTISSTSCQSAPHRRSSSSVLNAASSARVGPASWTGSLSANRSLVFRFACLEKEGK